MYADCTCERIKKEYLDKMLTKAGPDSCGMFLCPSCRTRRRVYMEKWTVRMNQFRVVAGLSAPKALFIKEG